MCSRVTLVFLFASMVAGHVVADDSTTVNREEKKTSAWLQYCDERSDQFTVYPAATPNKPFKKKKKALMLHAQPIRGDQVGAVYVWTDGLGRAAAVGTVILHPEKSKGQGTYFLVEELHSLYDEPVRGDLVSMQWNCRKPGVEWNELEPAAPPKGDKVRLKVMARRLVRDFSAEGIRRDADRTVEPLRFQPNPIHEYFAGEKDPDTISRYIFAGCMATDPEVLLCLEARRTPRGNRWFYSCAQFSNMRIMVRYRKKDIWMTRYDGYIGSKTLEGVSLAKD